MPRCTASLDHVDRVTDTKLIKIISGINKTTCSSDHFPIWSSDPFPTCSSDLFPIRLLMYHLHVIIPILQHIVNLCLTT